MFLVLSQRHFPKWQLLRGIFPDCNFLNSLSFFITLPQLYINFLWQEHQISRAALVHFNFRAGSTHLVPVCTVPHWHWVNKAENQQGWHGQTLCFMCRLNLLLLKGQRCVIFTLIGLVQLLNCLSFSPFHFSLTVLFIFFVLFRGSDGTLFHPGLERNETLHMYNKALCQSLPLVYQEDVDHHGVNTYR